MRSPRRQTEDEQGLLVRCLAVLPGPVGILPAPQLLTVPYARVRRCAQSRATSEGSVVADLAHGHHNPHHLASASYVKDESVEAASSEPVLLQFEPERVQSAPAARPGLAVRASPVSPPVASSSGLDTGGYFGSVRSAFGAASTRLRWSPLNWASQPLRGAPLFGGPLLGVPAHTAGPEDAAAKQARAPAHARPRVAAAARVCRARCAPRGHPASL